MLFNQTSRLAKITSPLGPDVLLLNQMGGGEELGRLFAYELQLTSLDANIDLNQLLGKPMSVGVQLADGGERHFHGIVAQCSQSIDQGQFASYQVTLRPWLWLLSRTSDCRIFQNLSIPQIIKQVFRDLGFSDFEDALSRPYREWEYCVQYRETSFDFVSRLMEQEGIYYFFRHEQDRHVLVLADAYGAHTTVPGYASIPYYPKDEQQRERDHLYNWHLAQQVQPGSLELNDYDFQRPSASIDVRSAMPRPHAAGDYPLYDYPGTYVQSADGEHYARTRIEALQTLHEQIEFNGNARGLGSGHLFSLTGFSRQDQNREYLIVGCRYYIVQESLESGGGSKLGAVRQQPDLHRRPTKLPPAGQHLSPHRQRPADRAGGRPQRRGNLDRPVRPRESAFLLGPPRPVQRKQLVLDTRIAILGRQELGLDADPTDRPGGDCELSGRRPGPADYYWAGVQRGADGALRFAGERDPERHEKSFEQGRHAGQLQ